MHNEYYQLIEFYTVDGSIENVACLPHQQNEVKGLPESQEFIAVYAPLTLAEANKYKKIKECLAQ